MPDSILRPLLLVIWIALGLGMIALIVRGWRQRVRKHADLPELPAIPELPDDAEALRGSYVATTTAGDPYDRIAAAGLGFRGAAAVIVDPAGILIARTGEKDLWIPVADLVGVARATWTIDRAVEEGGLHRIRWRLGDREVDTYLRMVEPLRLDAALRELGTVVDRDEQAAE